MSNGRTEFLERLLETFKVEAEEHLQVISDGLLELESSDAGSQTAIIEKVFREAHSLKGAARSVNLADVEMICQALESVFAALKNKSINPTPEILDVLHQATDIIRLLLSTDGASTSALNGDSVAQLARRLMDLERGEPAIQRTAPRPPEIPDADIVIAEQAADEATTPEEAALEPYLAGGKDVALSPMPDAATSPWNGGKSPKENNRPVDTVRLSTARLNSVLLQVEEMVSAKLAMNQFVIELGEVFGLVGCWKKQWSKVYPEVRNLSRAIEEMPERLKNNDGSRISRVVEFLDWNRGHLKELEIKIVELKTSVDRDSRTLDGMVEHLLEDMKNVLMLPFSSLLDGFPKLVRDLSRDQGKDVQLVVEGADTEVDRRILEELKDPLIHIVRNCIDHGIELPDERERAGKSRRATITIALTQQSGSKVEITVSDDGAGINLSKVKQTAIKRGLIIREQEIDDSEALSLIFQSELSTSDVITDLSGRGLGLAIVQEKAERLGGHVSVESQSSLGTTFRILLPLTLATFRGILVRAGRSVFVLPTMAVQRVTRFKRTDISTIERKETVTLDGRAISLVRLGDVLQLPNTATDDYDPLSYIPVLILAIGDKYIGFGVDEVLGEQEVLLKSLGSNLTRVRNVAGAAVLGSGKVIPVLNVLDLIKSATKAGVSIRPSSAQIGAAQAQRKMILVAEDSITSRMLLRNILEAAGYAVKTAVDGVAALSALRSEQIDLLVSDVEMPGLGGFDLTATIRADKQLAELPVVLVTSLGSREDRERGIEAGANAYIVKSSFDQSNLIDVVRRLV